MSDDNKDEYFALPIFTGKRQEPEAVPEKVAGHAFEEIIAAFKLRERTPHVAEDIPEFKM